MQDILITAPTAEPITVDELRNHLRLDTSSDDTYLSTLISSAREMVEQETRRALITQTRRVTVDRFPLKDNLGWWDGVREGSLSLQTQDFLELSIAPLQSITSVKYWTVGEEQLTFASTKYIADKNRVPGRIVLKTAQSWPTDLREHSAIEVDYVAGYGDTADKVPAPLRQVIQIMCADWYENRESVVVGTISSSIETAVSAVLEKYRVRRL